MQAIIYDAEGVVILLCRTVSQAEAIVLAMNWGSVQIVEIAADWQDIPR